MTRASYVLIVDDNPATQRMLRLALESEGYGVESALDAQTALALARGRTPDLILQDLILPDMDGLELVRRLRDLVGDEVPILALSGFLSRLEDPQTVRAGFTTLLAKPLEPTRLLTTIRGLLPRGLEDTALDGRAMAVPHGPSAQVTTRHATPVIGPLERQPAATSGQVLELTDLVTRLAASEKRYRSLLHGASDAIATLTPGGIVREVNHRWEEILGVPEALLIGRPLWDFVKTGTDRAHLEVFREMVAAGSGRTPPVPITLADGSMALLEFAQTMMAGADERVVFTIGRDVTEQRQLEDQLRQSQKLEAVAQLAGGVAHDFNNVLTAILGFCEVLLEDIAEGERGRGPLVEIKKAGQRAAGLTGQLLAFSRQQVVVPTILDVNALVTNVEPMLKKMIFEHIELELALQPHIGLVKMDETQLGQIVINLAVNARDAMPRGGKMTIETAEVRIDGSSQGRRLPVPPGRYIMLAVRDTGEGMDQASLAHIFEPFFTTKGVGTATGLGLSTVYGIVKQSGGDIEVRSQPGFGSTFHVYLPRASDPTPELRPTAATRQAMPRGTETVLLVEDDEAVRTLTRLALSRAGYQVLEAGDPKEALAVATRYTDHIHLILSDIIMPDSEGPPLVERLASARPGIRVLYMSGYPDEAVMQDGSLSERPPFLPKPFTPMVLAHKVREVLDAPART